MSRAKPLPAFTAEGLLPPGDYVLTLKELRKSLLVVGPKGKKTILGWDAVWRLQLVENLGIMCRQLWQIGISEIFVDGSFAEDKSHPNDIDGYFECDLSLLASGQLERELHRR